MFNAFWSVYPKKCEKIYALKCFNSALKYASPEEIIEGAKKYAAHCQSENTERQFIKNPSTWLNRGCWVDEYETTKQEISPDHVKEVRITGFYKTGYWRDEWGQKPEREKLRLVG